MPMTHVECRDATEAPFLVHHEIEDDSGFHSNLGFSTTTSRVVDLQIRFDSSTPVKR